MSDTVETIMDEHSTRVCVCNAGESGSFLSEIDAGGHALVADEPAASGGGDAGPSPYDLLLASLGACIAMTVRMYAERKEIPLRRVCVRLGHVQSHARDCVECDQRDGRVGRIERRVELEGELDEAQRARLLQIAERCPVHRTLSAGVAIEAVEGST